MDARDGGVPCTRWQESAAGQGGMGEAGRGCRPEGTGGSAAAAEAEAEGEAVNYVRIDLTHLLVSLPVIRIEFRRMGIPKLLPPAT